MSLIFEVVAAGSAVMLLGLAVWSWTLDHATYVARVLLIGLVCCSVWGIRLALPEDGSFWLFRLLWLPPVTGTAVTVFMLAKLANAPHWRPSRLLIAVFLIEPIVMAALALTNEKHQLLVRSFDSRPFDYSVGFGIHTWFCFILVGLSAIEMSRRTSEPSRWMRIFAATIMVFAVTTFALQVLQIPLSQALAAVALTLFTPAIHRGGVGVRDPHLGTGFDPHDPVTGVLSRRALESRLTCLVEKPVNNTFVLVIDVDRFKEVNDKYGHLIGDQILHHVARRMMQVEGLFELGRFGGDEFVGIIRNRSPEEALLVAQDMVWTVSATPIELDSGQKIQVTISVGMADCHVGAWQQWIARADSAMYQQKTQGGHGVVVSLTDPIL